MVKANVYLSDFSPDNMTYLIEILEKNGSFLKTYYYEVSFKIDKSDNNIELTKLKEIEDILSYLEVVYKKRSILESKLDNEESKFILNQLYKKLDLETLTLKQEKLIEDSKKYIKDKSYIRNYLKSKKVDK